MRRALSKIPCRLRSLLPILLMSACGLIVGWRINGGVADAVGAYALMIAFSFAVIWIGVLMGTMLPSVEAVQGVGFTAIFPITFIASTFVPVGTLPGVLRTIAEWNPLSATITATRELFGNPIGESTSWVTEHAMQMAVLWPLVITVVTLPMAVRAFHRLSR